MDSAIDAWEAVILDFNYDDALHNPDRETFELYVFAADEGSFPNEAPIVVGDHAGWVRPWLGSGSQWAVDADKKPYRGTIYLEDDALGDGWFFDPTPQDDSEFMARQEDNAQEPDGFEARFSASNHRSGSGEDDVDFYRAVLHQIGHPLGFYFNSSGVPGYSGFFHSPSGINGLIFDEADHSSIVTEPYYWEIPASGNAPAVKVAIHSQGAGELDHIYEGVEVGSTREEGVTIRANPFDLMGSPTIAESPPTVRRLITDTNAKVLARLYGYNVHLPSDFDTMHADLNATTGQVVVNGDAGSTEDEITISRYGSSWVVNVVDPSPPLNSPSSTTESFPYLSVTSMLVRSGGGADEITIDLTAGYIDPSGGITFDGGTEQDSLRITGYQGNTMTLAGVTSVELVEVTGSATVSTPASTTPTIAGQFKLLNTGSGATVTKSGSGTLTIQGLQTHGANASLIVSEGIVELQSNSGAPAVSGAPATPAVANLAIEANGGILYVLVEQDLRALNVDEDNALVFIDIPDGGQARIYGGGTASGSTVSQAMITAVWHDIANGYGLGLNGIDTHTVSNPQVNCLGLVLETDANGAQYLAIREMMQGDVNGDDYGDSGDSTILFAHLGEDGTWLFGDMNYDEFMDSTDATVIFAFLGESFDPGN